MNQDLRSQVMILQQNYFQIPQRLEVNPSAELKSWATKNGATEVLHAGRDAIVFEDDTWHVMKGGKWSHTLQDVADAPWSINKRRQGGDFALLKIERGRLKECIDYISTHLDPREYVVPSMSRTWLCTCLRTFYRR